MPDDIDNLIPRAAPHVAQPFPIDAEPRARRDPGALVRICAPRAVTEREGLFDDRAVQLYRMISLDAPIAERRVTRTLPRRFDLIGPPLRELRIGIAHADSECTTRTTPTSTSSARF